MRVMQVAGGSGKGDFNSWSLIGSIARKRPVQLAIAVVLAALLAIQLAGLLEQYAGASDHDPGNLVENGSFEEPQLSGEPEPGNWAPVADSAVPGWSSIAAGTPIEIMKGDQGDAHHGTQYVELDSNGNATGIFQDISTIPGTIYRVSWQFAARPGTGSNNNQMNVRWGDAESNLITEIEADGAGQGSAQWTYHEFLVQADSTTTRLTFEYAGNLNSFGALLDDVQVSASTCKTTVASGPWSDPSTWSCDDFPHGFGAPGAGNDAIISAGSTVNLTSPASVNNLTVDGTLNGNGYKLSVLGDFTLNGVFNHGDGKVSFEGTKPQKIKGDKEEYKFNKLEVSKEGDSKLEVEDAKKLKVKDKTEITKGKLEVGDAEFEGDVNIEENGELEGKSGTTKTYKGDKKKVDGKYEHNGSFDEFKGDKEQEVTGQIDKLKYYKLLIDKQKKANDEKSKVEFKKEIEVENDFEVEDGKAKVDDATFKGDVKIKKTVNEQNEVEKEGELEGTPDKKKTYEKNKTVDGKYTHNQSKDEFIGDKEQKINGNSEDDLEYHELLIKKAKESNSEEPSEKKAIFEKKLKILQELKVEQGKSQVGDAVFEGDVNIEKDGELEGTEGTTKTYKGHKKVDGKYTHKKSKDEFKGDEDQQIKGKTSKQEKLEYHELLIEKKLKKQTEFQKKLLVKQKTDVDKGKLKVGDADFEGDVEVKEDGELEGTEGKTKTYKGDKKVDGKYTHKQSKDRFIGDKQQQKLHGSKDTKYYELELEKSNQDDLLDALAKLQIEHQLRLIKGTLKTNTVFGDVVIEENGSLVLGEDEDPTEVTGDWQNDGEFDAGAGTVIFNGSESQSIGGSSDTTFNNLEVQNNTTLNQTIVVKGTLKVTGELTLGEGGAIEQGENFQLEVGSGANLNMGCVPGEKKLTGGGWINSPAGAYGADPGHTGKGDFNFPVHCDAEGTKPTGNVSFELNSAALEFESTSIDTMLVLGNEATLTGYGTVNGTGDYGLAAVAVEGAPGNSGDPNQLSIVIWDRNADSTVYDSGGPIDTGGGNIKIHSASSESPGGGGSPGKGPGGNGPPGRR